MSDSKHPKRHWCFTCYLDEVPFWKEGEDPHPEIKYIVFGNEFGELKHWHKQGYLCLKNKKRFAWLKKHLCATIHFEEMRTTPEACRDYCLKVKDGKPTNDFYEWGTFPVPERSNANVYADCIKAAERGDIEYIKEHHPGQFLRYKRTFDGLIKYPCETLEQPRGYWIHGAPGTGKDTSVMELKPYVKSHNKWWDGYKGEEYVLLSEFGRKDAEYLENYLLRWTDRYPFDAEVKGGVMKISPKRFYVTSNFTIDELFGHHPQYEAFKRRFHVIDFDTNTVIRRPEKLIVSKVKLIDF